MPAAENEYQYPGDVPMEYAEVKREELEDIKRQIAGLTKADVLTDQDEIANALRHATALAAENRRPRRYFPVWLTRAHFAYLKDLVYQDIHAKGGTADDLWDLLDLLQDVEDYAADQEDPDYTEALARFEESGGHDALVKFVAERESKDA